MFSLRIKILVILYIYIYIFFLNQSVLLNIYFLVLSVTGPQTKFVLASQFRSNLKIPVGCIHCDESKYKVSKERAIIRKLKLKVVVTFF
jgi:hypothetical protein